VARAGVRDGFLPRRARVLRARRALAQIGITVGVGPNAIVSVIAVLAGVAFTVLNVTGTENAAKLQNGIVALLLSMLVVFLGSACWRRSGGRRRRPRRRPGQAADVWEAVPILSVAALVFTSYLGFAQIATVAGEMKDPGRNLPLAMMVGSVVIVTVLYVLTIFVATNIFTRDTLLAAGETAMVEVGRALLGPAGALVIIVGGLLATMSSANASILSTSRAIYGVSKDALLPRRASRINLRYGTPHVALGMARRTDRRPGGDRTGPAARRGCLLPPPDHVRADVRRARLHPPGPTRVVRPRLQGARRPGDPRPRRALASFGLIAFMNRLSIAVGIAVIAVTAGWYFYYARDVELKGAL